MGQGKRYRLEIVDVFAEQPFAGNQLAVVFDAAELSDVQMQTIARETNFSETTFVLSDKGDMAKVRIFTPGSELPFAGHPTLGTAWALTRGRHGVVLDLAGGRVPVEFIDGIAWMIPPPVEFKGEIPRGDAAALLGLGADDLDPDWAVETAVVGPGFVLLPVKDLPTLQSARFDLEQLDRVSAKYKLDKAVHSVFAFTSQAYGADADFAARMFFNTGEAREDAATGSANACFAAYLYARNGIAENIVVEQGFEIQRPSRLYLQTGDVLRVGGKVQPVLEGHITI